MILLLDLGNTRLKWWILSNGRVQQQGANAYADLSALFEELSAFTFRRILGASVRSSAINADVELLACKLCPKAIEWAVSKSRNDLLINGYEAESTLGVDRWLNMLGASTYGAPTFGVISLGTAVTVDIVVDWHHCGGYIAPGYRAFQNLLSASTDGVRAHGADVGSLQPGRNTRQAVANAFVLMINGFIEGAAGMMRANGVPGTVKHCYVTGGDAAMLNTLSLPIVQDEQLLVRGLCRYFLEPLIDH